MDDDEIVELFLKKDESAIIHTAEKYGCRLRSISQRITADILTAEECENDTYLEAWNRIPPNEPRTYLIAFLSKIIRNISINKCIEKNRLKRRAYIVELSSEMEQCIPAVNDVESYVDGVEIGRVISTFLRKQPKEKRIIFMHRYYYCDTVLSIAKRFGYSESKVKIMLCSGVFVVLDATVNTKTEYADTSRMGIYLRLSDLKAVNTSKQHVVFFRGNADIARAEQVQLHNRWNLEFDTSALSGYEQIMQFDGNRLVESCLWTDRLELSDTWEDVQLLYVPVLDSTGKVRGLCGMEMSNLYFRLSYPMVEGSCGNIVTVLAPVDKKGNIYLDKAMFGDTKETYLSPSGTMTVKKGKYYNTYSTAFGNYIGRHELLGLKSCNGMPLAVLTLISEANYEKLTADNRRDWIIGTLLFLILLLVVSVGMSHRFVKPILRSLKALQEDTLTDENLSGISEVDALVDFMQKKRNTEKLENGGIPPNIEEMLKAFALRVETLTPSERMVLQYYVDGYTIQEIASLLYISIGTARKHNTNMNRKLGITVREELMLYIELFRKCNQLDKLTYSRTE